MSLRIEIQKGVPIPLKCRRTNIDMLEALLKMAEGDSFFVNTNKQYRAVIGLAQRNKIKIVSRAQEGGYRIWKVGEGHKDE